MHKFEYFYMNKTHLDFVNQTSVFVLLTELSTCRFCNNIASKTLSSKQEKCCFNNLIYQGKIFQKKNHFIPSLLLPMKHYPVEHGGPCWYFYHVVLLLES